MLDSLGVASSGLGLFLGVASPGLTVISGGGQFRTVFSGFRHIGKFGGGKNDDAPCTTCTRCCLKHGCSASASYLSSLPFS